MLDARLRCVAKHVRPGSVLADIGTDHARLPVYLVEQGVCPKAIASDLRRGPAAAARRTIRSAGLENRIEVRLGDGLTALTADEADDIVIAGMGGETAAAILDACRWIRDARYHLVLQPMTRPEELRRYLYEAGFSIRGEEIVGDGRHWYTVMDVVYTGERIVPDPVRCHVGQIAREETAYLGRVRDRLLKRAAGLVLAGDTAGREEALLLRRTAAGIDGYMKGKDAAGKSDPNRQRYEENQPDSFARGEKSSR